MFASDQIDAVAIAAIEGKGHTVYAQDERYAGRYIVGGLTGDVYPVGFPNQRQIVAEVAAKAVDAETLGVWIHEGLVYVDAGDTWTHLHAALQAAEQRGELAIWDRQTETEITVTESQEDYEMVCEAMWNADPSIPESDKFH